MGYHEYQFFDHFLTCKIIAESPHSRQKKFIHSNSDIILYIFNVLHWDEHLGERKNH